MRFEGMNRMVRRMVCAVGCLVMAVVLCPGSSAFVGTAIGEAETATAWEFDLSFSVNQEDSGVNLSPRMRGYADLLEALSIKGTFCYIPETRYVDLQLELIPGGSGEDSLPVRLYGIPESIIMTSPLLGNEKIVFSNPSLMEFAYKTYEHLGMKLQYLTMLYPYSHEFATKNIIPSWKKNINPSQKSRKISTESINAFTADITDYLEKDQDLVYYFHALGAGSESDEILQAEARQIPKYIKEAVTGKKPITVRVENGAETWVAGDQTLYTHTWSGSEEAFSLDLPETYGGYIPVFDYYSSTENGKMDLTLNAGWIKADDVGNDMANFRLEADSFPLEWPMNTDSKILLEMGGDILPGLFLGIQLTGKDDGNVTVSIRNLAGKGSEDNSEDDSGEDSEEGIRFSATGKVTPFQTERREYSLEEALSCVDILRVNDASLAEFVERVTKPVVKGLVRFLNGIPATACQSVMDDLTDSGILGMLLSDN